MRKDRKATDDAVRKVYRGQKLEDVAKEAGVGLTTAHISIKRQKLKVEGVTPADLAEDPNETLEYLLKRQDRHERLARKRENQTVSLPGKKPVGVTLFSDIHWGNKAVDYKALVRDTEMVRDCDGMYAFCLGDMSDNWIGKLAQVGGLETEISSEQEQAAVGWWVDQLKDKMPVVVAGNHDNRTIRQANVDLVRRLMPQTTILYDPDEIRFTLTLGKGSWVWKCRHRFRGNSQWNETHALEKDGKMYDDWDFAAHGHYHHPTMVRPFYDERGGKVCYACNIGTYEMSSDFARMLGYQSHHTTHTATVILFPDGRVHVPVGATLEESADYLTYLRR